MIKPFGIMLALCLLLARNALAAPVGMVTQLTGKAEVKSAAGSAWKTLRLLDRLEVGDNIRCSQASEAVLILFDSAERFSVGANATAVIEAKSVKGASKNTGLHGPAIQVAKTMVGDRPHGFNARPALSHKRMTPDFPGWVLESQRHFVWEALPNAAAYTFTLFDSNDNVVWSARVGESQADLPADLPAFIPRRAYLWRVSAFGKSGKPLPETSWGAVTFLSQADADALKQSASDLEEEIKQDKEDITSLALMAELYRSYGVLEKTLETLERPAFDHQPGIEQTRDEIYRQLGAVAVMLAKRHPAPEEAPDTTP